MREYFINSFQHSQYQPHKNFDILLIIKELHFLNYPVYAGSESSFEQIFKESYF